MVQFVLHIFVSMGVGISVPLGRDWGPSSIIYGKILGSPSIEWYHGMVLLVDVAAINTTHFIFERVFCRETNARFRN